MTPFQPQIQIVARAGGHVVGLILPSTPEVRFAPNMVTLAGDLSDWTLLRHEADSIVLRNATHEVTLAVLHFVGELSAETRATLRVELHDAVSEAFVRAAFAAMAQQPVVPTAPLMAAPVTAAVAALPGTIGAAPTGRLRRAGQWTRRHKGKSLFAMIVAAGAVSVAYGYMTKPVDQDPFAFTVNPSNQKQLEAQIAARVQSAANDGTSLAGLDGQSVAMGTMRAMGLEPGKANAGCLVGVKR
ncbi:MULTISPECIES: hypothetical protein [Cupriavidus]